MRKQKMKLEESNVRLVAVKIAAAANSPTNNLADTLRDARTIERYIMAGEMPQLDTGPH
jgi:hypothetical protein